MSCCGSNRGTTTYRVTAPDGTVTTYLTQPEAQIALATIGGGSLKVIRDDGTQSTST